MHHFLHWNILYVVSGFPKRYNGEMQPTGGIPFKNKPLARKYIEQFYTLPFINKIHFSIVVKSTIMKLITQRCLFLVWKCYSFLLLLCTSEKKKPCVLFTVHGLYHNYLKSRHTRLNLLFHRPHSTLLLYCEMIVRRFIN